MAPPASPKLRPVTGIDIAASLVAHAVPAPLLPAIDQARRDAHAVVDGFLGRGERSYRSAEHPARAPVSLDAIDPIEALLPRGLRARYAALKRDANVVLKSLQGEHPPPLVTRRAKVPRREVSALTNAQPSTTRRLRVVEVVRETHDSLTLRLEDVTGAKVPFQAGQFLSVRADVRGETLWRAYSICTAPTSGALAITIKRVEGGRVSNHLNELARVGDVLEARGPSGRFTLERSSVARQVVLFAGGSGITPLMSHARHLLHSEPEAHVTLLYGSRGVRDIIFREQLDELAQSYAERFVVRHVLSEPSEGFVSGMGMLDKETTLGELSRLGIVDAESTVYLSCGPEPMMKAVHEALSERGVPALRIMEERFTGPDKGDLGRAPSFREQLVTLRVSGKESTVRVKPEQTILEAALADNLSLDFSCTMGGCGACMAQLCAGSVHMDEPNCLSAAERAQGKILTCISHPTSACRVEKV